jgi:hypothetical protein
VVPTTSAAQNAGRGRFASGRAGATALPGAVYPLKVNRVQSHPPRRGRSSERTARGWRTTSAPALAAGALWRFSWPGRPRCATMRDGRTASVVDAVRLKRRDRALQTPGLISRREGVLQTPAHHLPHTVPLGRTTSRAARCFLVLRVTRQRQVIVIVKAASTGACVLTYLRGRCARSEARASRAKPRMSVGTLRDGAQRRGALSACPTGPG